MNDNYDLFSLLNIERPKEDEKKGKEKKEKLPIKSYVAPFTVVFGHQMPFVIEGGEITEERIWKEVQQQHPELQKGIFTLYFEGKDKAFVVPSRVKYLAKGEVELNANTKCYFCGQSIDLSSVMTDEECTASIDDLQGVVKNAYPDIFSGNFGFYAEENIVIPSVSDLSAGKDAVDFPFNLNIFGREFIEFTEENYVRTMEERKISITVPKDGKIVPSRKNIELLVKLLCPDFKEVQLVYTESDEGKNYTAFLSTGTAALVPKKGGEKTLFPTEGACISLVFTKIPLTPEMFGGKEEVEEGEIFRILTKDYPEYSKERTELLLDKKRKIIIPNLKGSRKGATSLISEKEQMEIEGKPYALEYPVIEGVSFRSETLPFAHFSVAKDESVGAFHWFLPKIPGMVFSMAERFFRQISEKYNTEAMLQVFWDPEARIYELQCPRQRASYATLEVERDYVIERKKWLVMDLHSHGEINCSFSGTDDEDEKGTRLYGVFYGFTKRDFLFDLRAGTGGYFWHIEKGEVFETVSNLLPPLNFEEWENNIIFR